MFFKKKYNNPIKYQGNEIDYLKKVIKGETWSSLSGSWVGKAEQLFTKKVNSKFSIAMNSGTSTLHSILESLDLKHGDEILMPALTVIMDSTVCFLNNLIPVYVDVDPETFLIDPTDLEKKITSKSRAIITVSLYGNVPNMEKISEIAKKNSLFIIEDNAQGVLAKRKGLPLGSWGIASSWSFENTKHISTGEGGMVTTRDENLAEKIRKIGGHGFKNLRAEEGRVRLTDDIFQNPGYERHDLLGWNYRMSEIIAAVALAQIEQVEKVVEGRRYAAKQLINAIGDSKLLVPQKVEEGTECDYFTLACVYNEEYSKGLSWQEFRLKFKELTGMGIYGAWQLQYKEPTIYNGAFKYRNLDLYKSLDYTKTNCPNAEHVQSRIMQFKTNIRSKSLARKIGSQLSKLIKEYSL